jgi:predicted DNA-binding protein YlxM (UPF0122 family)
MPLQRSLNGRRRAGHPRALAGRTLVVRLFDAYAGLLTRRQRDVLAMYFHDDFSLGEIAERSRVTRQAVFDSLRRSVRELRSFENRVGVVAERARRARARRTALARLAEVEREVARRIAGGQTGLGRLRRALRTVRERL